VASLSSRARQAHGAAFATYGSVRREAFRFTSGEASLREYRSSKAPWYAITDRWPQNEEYRAEGERRMSTSRRATASAEPERWSQRVAETSSALDLEPGVFTLHDPRRIALSLKASAERSQRRKATPFRSAMSMLTFYINRAGRQLDAAQRARLEAAKEELRVLFDEPRRGRERAQGPQ